MFGPTKKEVAVMIEEAVSNFRVEVERKFRGINAPPDAKELARGALKEILAQVNPVEFLDNILVTKGLSLENLVRQVVAQELERDEYVPAKDEIMERVVEDVAERAWDELDMDALYAAIGEKVVEYLSRRKENANVSG